MKKDLLADYFLNEFIPLHPSYSKDDLFNEFTERAKKLGLNSSGEELLFEAFTHKSFSHEAKVDLSNNERLEFLGDSVLQLVVSEELMRLHPDEKEGKLSKLRSSIVNEKSLSKLARNFSFDKLIMLGKGELREEGYAKDSLLANCFEAYLGALYLSVGFEASKKAILEMFEKAGEQSKNLFRIEAIEEFDAKSRLQELLVKSHKEPPKYVCVDAEGSKEKMFHITVTIKGEKLGELRHKSKKKGMQLLAKTVLEEMLNNPNTELNPQEKI